MKNSSDSPLPKRSEYVKKSSKEIICYGRIKRFGGIG